VNATENVTFSAALLPRSVLAPRERHVILSPRETQVISLIADGLNSREIGEVLFLAESTIREHVKGVLAKLRARNRAHAVTIWLHDYAPESVRGPNEAWPKERIDNRPAVSLGAGEPDARRR
jgi:DNA-binding CsgD family transcriptional regulator